MTLQRTPLRSKSSLGSIPGSVSTPQQPSQPRGSLTDLRRPPSSRGYRPASPRHNNLPAATTRSRPGSSLGMYGSRPSTPSFSRPQEPYTGSITVSIRPNPYTVNQAENSPWSIQDYSRKITNTTDSTSFQFDNVFPADTSLSNREVYNKSCSNMVQRFLNNSYNGTVFAYGMTGSGKTFSIKGSDGDPGFVRLAIDDIFNKLETNITEKQYTLSMSYLEIYNEKIIDLLNITNTAELKIRDDPEYGTKVVGVSSPDIFSKEQILQLIEKGDNNRKTSATEYNSRSSRSHSILQIKLKTIDLNDQSESHSILSLCDLAGSERATSSAERRKEGAFINKSLLALSTVINKLSISSNSTPSANEHIPYRDSKLTRLLQPALSGASLVSILCTIHMGSIGNNPSQQFISETYNTLRFAARAKDIVMNVQRNQASAVTDEETLNKIKSMQKTIDDQKNELTMLKMQGYNASSISTASSSDKDGKILHLEAENKILHEKLEHLSRLADLQKTETIILKNQALNDILGFGIDTPSSQIMMSNLEDFYRKVTYEVSEYKLYIDRLEGQLKASYQSSGVLGNAHEEEMESSTGLSDKQTEAMLKDQEEEIYNLKELIKDKDHIIKSLSRTTKIRRLLDSNNANHQDATTIIPAAKSTYPNSFDHDLEKENNNIDLKEFHISPKKKQAQGPTVRANNARYIM